MSDWKRSDVNAVVSEDVSSLFGRNESLEFGICLNGHEVGVYEKFGEWKYLWDCFYRWW